MADTKAKEYKVDKKMLMGFIKSKTITLSQEDGTNFFTGSVLIRDKKTTILKLGGGTFTINFKFATSTQRQKRKGVPVIEYKPVEDKATKNNTEETKNKELTTSNMKVAMDVIFYDFEEHPTVFTESPIKLTSDKKDNIYLDVYANMLSNNLIMLNYTITFDPEEEETTNTTTNTINEEDNDNE